MKIFRATVAQRIAAGYVLVILFCVGAAVYALLALGAQNRRSQTLVTVDFQALGLARDLRGNLLAQERLERQLLILRDPDLVDLLRRRQEELGALWERFRGLPLEGGTAISGELAEELGRAQDRSRALFARGLWDDAQQLSREVLFPARNQLVAEIEQFLHQSDASLHATLNELSRESDRAYRVTLALVFAGVALAALVACRLIFKLHRAFASLTHATREVAEGRFDTSLTLESDDEFGQLARDFADMAEQLKELERQRLDANPLTRLPGNRVIERELQDRLESGRPFAHVYVDLDHFKAYNDRYGYQAGSEVLTMTGNLVQELVLERGTPGDLVGHIGGDDYVVLTVPDRAEAIARGVIEGFDRAIPPFYSEEDRTAGHFVAEDRFGVERTFPLLTVSIAVVTSENLKDPSPSAVGRECAKIKEHLKRMDGSNYLIDRRDRR